MKYIAWVMIVLFIPTFTGLHAQIIHVPADESTIQDGIAEADHGDTVLVAPGTYFENINFWGKNITVASHFLTTRDTAYISQTVIDGNAAGSTVLIINGEDSTALLCGFTIRNGWNDAYGGGINCFNSSPRLDNLIVHNNVAFDGGGICFQPKSASDPPSHPVVRNVTLYNNSAQFGGAICLESGAGTQAGTLRATLQNILVYNNNATRGGGILIMGKTDITLQNVTIAGNTAVQSGGGISYQDYPLTITNAIIWNNSPEALFGTGSPIVRYSDIEGGNPGLGTINEDPLFTGTGKNPFTLSAGSPCIDTGTPDTTGLNLPPADLVGNHRLWDGDGDQVARIDMGAYEFGSGPYRIEPFLNTNCSLIQVNCYPNPFSDYLVIEYELDEPVYVVVDLFDHIGKKVTTLTNEFRGPGKNQLRWSSGNLSAGVYFLRLSPINRETLHRPPTGKYRESTSIKLIAIR